jgi:adenylate cyclase
MTRETERKFMVKSSFLSLKQNFKSERILQAYLSAGPEKTIRLRICGSGAFLTIKSGYPEGSFSHCEWEYEIPSSDAEEMLHLCLPGRVEKTRYYVPAGEHTFEIDVFDGANEGLMIAEVELKSETEEFEKPDWLGEEVTGNPAYYNVNLLK